MAESSSSTVSSSSGIQRGKGRFRLSTPSWLFWSPSLKVLVRLNWQSNIVLVNQQSQTLGGVSRRSMFRHGHNRTSSTNSKQPCHQTSSPLNNLIYVHLFDCVFALFMFLYHHYMLNYCELYLMCEIIPLLCPNRVILFLLHHMIHPSDQSHHSMPNYIITLHMSFAHSSTLLLLHYIL